MSRSSSQSASSRPSYSPSSCHADLGQPMVATFTQFLIRWALPHVAQCNCRCMAAHVG